MVVADAGPLRYLLQIGSIHLLPRLFERVFVPEVVVEELRHPSAPSAVREWMEQPAQWLEVLPVTESLDDPALRTLGAGEKSAIILGLSLSAKLILMDDRRGAKAALLKGFEVTGTLGILDVAAGLGLIDLGGAFASLRKTNFRYRQEMLDALLTRHMRGGDHV